MLYFDEIFLNTGEKRRKNFCFLSRYPLVRYFMTASVSLFGFRLLRNSAQAFVCKNKGLLLSVVNIVLQLLFLLSSTAPLCLFFSRCDVDE